MFTIETHPLLVYVTALPFSQNMPAVYKHFHDHVQDSTVIGNIGPLDFALLGTPHEHDGLVWSMAYSPDGTRLVSGSLDGTVQIWDTATGTKILPVIQGHQNVVLSVVFSPDGTRIASCSADESVRIWAADDGTQLFLPLRGHDGAVVSVSFSSNGAHVVSGSDDKSIRIWDAISGVDVLWPLRGHEGCVTLVAFSPDDTNILSCSRDNTIRMWNATSGSQIFSTPLVDSNHSISSSITFSPDGHLIISKSRTGLTAWDAKSGCRRQSTTGHEYCPSQSIAVISGREYSPYWIEDLETGRTISNLPFLIRASCSLSHENTLAVGTTTGNVLFIRFPMAFFVSADTPAISQRRSDDVVPHGAMARQPFIFSYSGGRYYTYRHHTIPHGVRSRPGASLAKATNIN
jgi:WD40 repeat protein